DAYRGSATARATSAARVSMSTAALSAAFTFADTQVIPAAVAVKVTAPAPDADQVQRKVSEDPPVIFCGPAGETPPCTATSGPPGPTAMDGSTLRTSSPPVFVTVSATLNHWPVETTAGAEVAAARTPAARTLTGPAATVPVASTAPVLTFVPVTVVESVTRPDSEPVKVNVKVRAVPPESVTGMAGDGPAFRVSPPAPSRKSGSAAVTPLAVPWPVLVTVRVTSTRSPRHTVESRTASEASSA